MDPFTVRQRQVGGQSAVEPINDNFGFVISALETLAGSDEPYFYDDAHHDEEAARLIAAAMDGGAPFTMIALDEGIDGGDALANCGVVHALAVPECPTTD